MFPRQPGLQCRIGVSLGQLFGNRDDISGNGVNAAARLQSLSEADTRSMMRNMYDSAIARGVVGIEYWNNATTPTGYRDDRLDFCDPNGVRYDEMKRWILDVRTVHLP